MKERLDTVSSEFNFKVGIFNHQLISVKELVEVLHRLKLWVSLANINTNIAND